MGENRRTRVKICGITRVEDARYAADAGVDALGFIFGRTSPRYISIGDASEIIRELPPFVERVGVFVDSEIDELESCGWAGLSSLQLHGSESPQYCQELKKKLPFCHIIKAFRVGSESLAEDFAPYQASVDAFLLDTYVEGEQGGTGQVFDWSIINRLQLKRPLLLAGGLTPYNIMEALEVVKPHGLDVNSGVEESPGIKDHNKIKRLMAMLGSHL
jgi:phosphoribosylanthranilate isomerase